jgi:hypothetical protein
MTNTEHLEWIYQRLLKVHGESEYVDYMHRLKEIVDDAARVCKWDQEDDEYGSYDTDCGRSFSITEGTPEENGMKYCCFCGKTAVGTPFEGYRDD